MMPLGCGEELREELLEQLEVWLRIKGLQWRGRGGAARTWAWRRAACASIWGWDSQGWGVRSGVLPSVPCPRARRGPETPALTLMRILQPFPFPLLALYRLPQHANHLRPPPLHLMAPKPPAPALTLWKLSTGLDPLRQFPLSFSSAIVWTAGEVRSMGIQG